VRNPIKRVRGQAAVELAVTMILLIPLILYTLFLEDLLAYKLDSQEPTIVAGWDHETVNYQTSNPDVGGMNRLKYCDHTAAFDSYTKSYDCDQDGVHHEASAAHQCWLVPGANQLACTNNSSFGSDVMPSNTEFTTWYGMFNKGGMARCTANVGVMNYFLPNKFFNWAAREEVTNRQKLGGAQAAIDSSNASVHGDATGGSSQGASWVMREEVFAVLTDPWALNTDDDGKADLPDTSPDGFQEMHPFWQRASVYFDNPAGGVGFMRDGNSKAKDYRSGLDELISKSAEIDLVGDDPSTLPLAWKKDKQRDFNDGYASGWEDSRMRNANRANEYPKDWGP
jgi:hypothetical protein